LGGISPGCKPGDNVELLKKAADDLVGVRLGTEPIQLRQDAGQRLHGIIDGGLGKVLALLLETALALHEYFTIERGNLIERLLAQSTGVGH
jgi:hypothetical protein